MWRPHQFAERRHRAWTYPGRIIDTRPDRCCCLVRVGQRSARKLDRQDSRCQGTLEASDAGWGLANSLGTVGELTGFGIIAVLIGRLSTRRIAIVSAVAIAVSSPLLGLAPTVTALIAALFVWMVANKALGTTMGALALVEQHRAGRVLMARYDAVYSTGMLAGGGLAWLCIRVDVSPSLQFAITNAGLLAGVIVALRHLPDEEQSPNATEGIIHRLRHRLQPLLLLLAGISCLASVIDSTLSQWGAIFLTTVADGDSSWGALAYPAMMGTKIVVLVRMDRLVRSLGWLPTVYLSAGLTIAAILIATATTTMPAVALAGVGLVGAGTATLGPLVNTGAAAQPGVTAGEGRTVLEFGEIPAYLAMPAVIGLLSNHLGIRPAIAIATVTAILGCTIIGHVLRPNRLQT